LGLALKMNLLDKAVDYLRDHAGDYAVAEAQLVYMTELRKTVKAQLMKDFELQGHKTTAAQEREAYADPKYVQHLLALQQAVEQREKARWLMVAAQARIEAEKANIYANNRTDRAMR
jgi:16S rRNA G966 N2-methylase RsmD